MKEVDAILEDEQLLDLIYEHLGRRHPPSRKRGRPSTPAEGVLRLMVLKHGTGATLFWNARSKPTCVNQVLRQTTAQVFRGVTDTPGKIVSVSWCG